jgi:hypothetical protein
MALFEDYYDRTPEDEKTQKRPKIRRDLEKGFKKFYENLSDQKDKQLDKLDELRKELSTGNIEKLKEIDLVFLTIEEIDKRIANMDKERETYLGKNK